MNQQPAPNKPKDDLGYLLWQTTMSWHRQMNRALDVLDLTHTQFAILSALRSLLKESEFITQKAIAERSNTDTMMVSKVLRTLEKKGIVKRSEHETDTRAKCVFFTAKGDAVFQKAYQIATASNHTFFKQLSDQETFRMELIRIIGMDQTLKN